jgi:UDP-N-acetyl-D-glucosamine dehydrogenase
MPAYNAARIADLLNMSGSPVFGTEILAVGVAYKPGIADDRESAALQVIVELVRRGASVSVLDPVVGRERISALGYKPVEVEDDLSRFKLAAILTDHPVIDYETIASQVPIVYDARGVYRKLGITANNVSAL